MPRRTPEGEAFRHPASFRMTPDARTKLEAAAKASGRSLSQEMEFRLEASFERDDLRQIIREEVRAALAGSDHSGWFKAMDAEYRVERVS